ncbi:MAG: hypothetical protein IKL37_04575 [Alphaproteobacteria bacterium]|nr:hypothetical protein [Alphaproteobacteria bacterium]
MNIETIATSKVSNVLSKTDILVPDIKENDKLPSLDGQVLVYQSPNHSKENLLGYVPVQVKGVTVTKNNKNEMRFKFPVQMSDLKNYYKIGGAIFFVVKIYQGVETIYYKSLLPADLHVIIECSKKLKQKNIRMKRLPENPIATQNIFVDFLTDRNLQRNIPQTGIMSEEELHKLGYTKHFFRLRCNNIFDMLGQSTYKYSANSVGITVCNGGFTVDRVTAYNGHMQISVDGKIFFQEGFVDMSLQECNFLFGNKVLTLSIPKNSRNTGKILIEPLGKISDITTCFEFMIATSRNNSFFLNDQRFMLTFDKKTLDEVSRNLQIVRKIQEMLSVIDVKADISVYNADTIHSLYAAAVSLLENRPMTVTNINQTGLIRIVLPENNKHLLFRVEATEDGATFLVKDIFKSHPPIKISTSTEDKIMEENTNSYFLLLHETDFYNSINFDINIVQKDMFKYLGSDANSYNVNFILIHYWFKLLKAFDSTKQHVFLDKATEVLDRIKQMQNINQTLADNIYLNEMQIIKRLRPFSDQEKIDLNNFISKDKADGQLLGAYLLLGYMEKAKSIFEHFSDYSKELFKTYPIFKFWTD